MTAERKVIQEQMRRVLLKDYLVKESARARLRRPRNHAHADGHARHADLRAAG